MSETATRLSLDDIGNPVCEFCGCEIDEPDRDCPALDNGVCAP